MPISKRTLTKYAVLNSFIETGTCLGNAVNLALAVGFKKIASVELSKDYYEKAIEKFESYKQVKLYHGDSTNLLDKMLTDAGEPSVFWLDAHYSGGQTVRGNKISPLKEELAVIANHKIKNNIIIIDDVKAMTRKEFAMTKEEVAAYLKSINKTNIVLYEDVYLPSGKMLSNNIMVAYPAIYAQQIGNKK